MKKDNYNSLINKIISNWLKKNLSKNEFQLISQDKFDQLTNDIIKFIDDNYYLNADLENKIDHFSEILLNYALHNYSAQIEINDENDTLNAIATSINLLGEELNHSTITRHYLEDIFNSVGDMFLVVDEFGYIDSVNKSTIDKLLFNSEELLRKKLDIILDSEINISDLLNNFYKGKFIHFVSKNRQKIPVEVILSSFVRGDNQKIGNIIIARDISEMLKYQHEIEEQNRKITITNEELQKALLKAEESDRLKTAFLQNISHEIRTPLNVIVGLIQLLNKFEVTKEEREEYSDILEKSSKRLIEIVNNVLDISKIETGQFRINERYFSINALMNELFSSFYHEANEKSLQFSFVSPLQEKYDLIKSDNGKLNQILTNLIKNAIKFTDVGSVSFGYKVVNNFIEFYVKDTGIGIADDQKDKIFERFIQADNSLTRKHDGAGLGLSISKGLIELLGGTIRSESQVDIGTTFYFTIPFKPIEVVSQEQSSKKQNINFIGRTLKILAAEDDDLNYLIIDTLMRSNNQNIVRAKTGKEAVELCFNNNDFDLILMDIRMPELDGIEATKKIRNFNQSIPIIALTAFAYNEEREMIIDAGFTDYLTKPIKIEELFDLIKKYIQ